MSSETVEVPAPYQGSAAQQHHGRLEVARPEAIPLRPNERSRVVEAKLAAELAQQRHVTVELQHAILPLHDEPFDLPGLRAVVRYLPASLDSRVGGDWYITAELPTGQVL